MQRTWLVAQATLRPVLAACSVRDASHVFFPSLPGPSLYHSWASSCPVSQLELGFFLASSYLPPQRAEQGHRLPAHLLLPLPLLPHSGIMFLPVTSQECAWVLQRQQRFPSHILGEQQPYWLLLANSKHKINVNGWVLLL